MRTTWLWLAVTLVLVAAGGGWWVHVTRPEYRWQRGREALRQRDWFAVEDIAQRLEAAGAADRARVLRGESLFRQQRYVDAVTELNKVRDEGALRLQAAAIQGQCFLRLNLLGEAEGTLTFVVDQQPDHVDAHRGLAVLHYDLGNLTRAVQHLESVARLDARDGRPHRQIGFIYKDLQKHAEAIAAYHEALRRDLTATVRQEARLELAETLVQQLDYQAALQVLDDPEAARPEGILALGLRGECLWGLSRAEEARPLLDQALARYPAAGRLLRLRGRIHLTDRHPDQAAALLEKAVALDPHDHVSRYHLALAYTQLDRSVDAVAQQERVQEIRNRLALLTQLSKEAMDKPWDAEVRRRLAEVCEQLGRADLAAMWRRAAAACPPPLKG
jgi:tetratricopeptide (TPR) repeat protein